MMKVMSLYPLQHPNHTTPVQGFRSGITTS